MGFEESLLFKDLNRKNPSKAQRLIDLKDKISKILDLSFKIFPHYTDHSISHSQAIIDQLSLFLYEGSNVEEPCIDFSCMELFILISSIFLHDIGMVITEEKLIGIFESEEWKKWISKGNPGYKKYLQIQEIKATSKKNDDQKDYLYNLHFRWLLSEFLRIRHHLYSSEIIESDQSGFYDSIMSHKVV